ncbi:MAG: hypothetical protein SGARI_004079, partial [Bacillariaceae sp.]
GGRHGRDRDYRDSRDRDGFRGRGGPPRDDYFEGRGGRGGPPLPFDGPRGGGPPPHGRHGPPPLFRGGDRPGGDRRRRGEGLPGVSLLIRNIGSQITSQDLQTAFGRIGDVRDVYVPRDYHSQKPKGFAFIEYANMAQAREARDEMDRFRIKGCELEVVFAQERRKTPNEMRGKDGGGGGGGGGDHRRDRYGGGGGRDGGRGFERSSSFERHKQRRHEESRRDQDKRPRSPGADKPASEGDEKKSKTSQATESSGNDAE